MRSYLLLLILTAVVFAETVEIGEMEVMFVSPFDC